MLTENSMELFKVIDERYGAATEMFRAAAKRAEEQTVVRDIYNLFKKTLNHMHRTYPTWKTMNHGVFGYDDDEMGNLRVVVGTDVTFLISHEEGMRHLLTVQNLTTENYIGMETIPAITDKFFDCVEIFSPNIHDDVLLASNFIGIAESIGYKPRKIEYTKLNDEDRGVVVIMVKKDRTIELTLNLSTSVKDISQLAEYEQTLPKRDL
jgi:hypothetical protein